MRISGAPAYHQRPVIEPQERAPNGSARSRVSTIVRQAPAGEEARPRHELPRHFALRRALAAYLTAAPPEPAATTMSPRIAETV